MCPVSSCHASSERRLIEMGLIHPPEVTRPALPQPDNSTLIQQLLREQESFQQQLQRKDEEIRAKNSENQQLQLQLTNTQQQLASTQQNLTRQRETATAENLQLQLQLTSTLQQLTRANQSDTENQQLMATLRQQIDVLQRRVTSLSTANPSQNSQEVEFWQVSPEEVTVREDQILGRGAWGYVAKGTFRGTSVAVKRVYPEILQHEQLWREFVERFAPWLRFATPILFSSLLLFSMSKQVP